MKGRSVGQKNNKKIRAFPMLKEIMEDNNISQKELAEETGLSQMCIWKVVNRKSGSKRTAKQISDYLGYNQAILFEVIK